MDASELAFLENLPLSQNCRFGPDSSLITLKVNNRTIVFPELAQMQYVKSTLVKLILVVRFIQKIGPIWNDLNIDQRSNDYLAIKYIYARAIMFCLRVCCGSDLIKFHTGRKNPFNHNKYSCKCSLNDVGDVILSSYSI